MIILITSCWDLRNVLLHPHRGMVHRCGDTAPNASHTDHYPARLYNLEEDRQNWEKERKHIRAAHMCFSERYLAHYPTDGSLWQEEGPRLLTYRLFLFLVHAITVISHAFSLCP